MSNSPSQAFRSLPGSSSTSDCPWSIPFLLGDTGRSCSCGWCILLLASVSSKLHVFKEELVSDLKRKQFLRITYCTHIAWLQLILNMGFFFKWFFLSLSPVKFVYTFFSRFQVLWKENEKKSANTFVHAKWPIGHIVFSLLFDINSAHSKTESSLSGFRNGV